ncbi:MAG: tRNA pseudouridine65 synthase [Marivirga sp.]
MDTPLDIIYQDEHMVAINKPHGLLVHRSKMAADADVFALQLLRDQIGQKVYPAHRIDRKTSGALLFALSEDVDKKLKLKFAERQIRKSYWAIVRGYTQAAETIDYPLRKENGLLQEAVTAYKTLATTEIEVALGKHPTSRYSLIEVLPETGRMHQIRKHMAHIYHPIIGDRPHGCNKQNKLFKEKWDMDKMMLHAKSLSLPHPVTEKPVTINAALSSAFENTIKLLSFKIENINSNE